MESYGGNTPLKEYGALAPDSHDAKELGRGHPHGCKYRAVNRTPHSLSSPADTYAELGIQQTAGAGLYPG